MINTTINASKVFDNAEVEEGAAVSMERFCLPEAQEEIMKHVGHIHDAAEEFSNMDKDGLGEVRFDCLMKWVFKRSLEQKKILEE